ncbi:MAG TPA: hypothetical protein VKA84_25810 [Gemmatimonadaceae bacterium]|nr:hypothetical protein [Gemmatimonadaceae bacterium]
MIDNVKPDVLADIARARRFDGIVTLALVALVVLGAILLFGVGLPHP